MENPSYRDDHDLEHLEYIRYDHARNLGVAVAAVGDCSCPNIPLDEAAHNGFRGEHAELIDLRGYSTVSCIFNRDSE